MVNSKENYKFDLGVKGLTSHSTIPHGLLLNKGLTGYQCKQGCKSFITIDISHRSILP